MRLARALLALALSAPSALTAQAVLVAPHGVFIDHRTRTASFEVYNPGTRPIEVSVWTAFGYPVTDSLGTLTLRMPSEADAGEPSAAGWLEAHPARLLLRPAERQRVRLLARPPEELPDGEYWSRLVVAAKSAHVPAAHAGVDSGGATQGVPEPLAAQAGVSLELRTVIAALYRKGPVRTGVALSDLRAVVDGDSLVARVRLTRQGNAAFLGTARGRLVDSAGRQVASFATPLGVYHELEPRLTAPVGGLAPGRYVLRLELVSDRSDLPRERLLRATPARDSTEVVVPHGP